MCDAFGLRTIQCKGEEGKRRREEAENSERERRVGAARRCVQASNRQGSNACSLFQRHSRADFQKCESPGKPENRESTCKRELPTLRTSPRKLTPKRAKETAEAAQKTLPDLSVDRRTSQRRRGWEDRIGDCWRRGDALLDLEPPCVVLYRILRSFVSDLLQMYRLFLALSVGSCSAGSLNQLIFYQNLTSRS